MNATTTRQTIRTLDATYRQAGLLCPTAELDRWYIRVDGVVLMKVYRPLEWAMDAERAGMDILAN